MLLGMLTTLYYAGLICEKLAAVEAQLDRDSLTNLMLNSCSQ